MNRRLTLVLGLGLAACGPTLPPEEAAEAEFQQARSARTRQESMEALDRAIALRPRPEYFLLRALHHRSLQNLQAAMADYGAALQLGPADDFTKPQRAAILANRALVHEQLGRAPEAEADLTEAIRLVPEYAEAYLQRARLRRKGGRAKEAEEDAAAARGIGAAMADGFYNEGVRAITSGDPGEAEKMLGFALELDPGHSRAHVAMARLFMERRRFDEAVKELDQAIPVHPKDAELYYHRATAKLAGGHPDRALADYDKAVQLAPREAPYLAGRGLARYRATKDVEGAGADFEAALKADATSYAAWFNRGMLAHEQKQLEAAERDLRRALSIHASPEGTIALGRVLHDRGSYDKALEFYRQALELYRGPDQQKAFREEIDRTRRAKEAAE
jgi:tetratricopeptide (TPR) repeat protein